MGVNSADQIRDDPVTTFAGSNGRPLRSSPRSAGAGSFAAVAMEENQNSSAYSSLANSTNEISEEVASSTTPPPMPPTPSGRGVRIGGRIKGSSGSAEVSPEAAVMDDLDADVSGRRRGQQQQQQRHRRTVVEDPVRVRPDGRHVREVGARSPASSSASLEIRSIIDDYNATLNKATKDIRALTAEKRSLEVEYEKLLTVNEELAADLASTIRDRNELRRERDSILKANDELYDEAQRLNDEESAWLEARAELEARAADLSRQLQELDAGNTANEALAEENARLAEGLRAEKADLAAKVAQLEADAQKLRKRADLLEDEREDILSRKEKVSGENMQLILEAQEFQKVKAEMGRDLREMRARFKDLERENVRLKDQLEEDRRTAASLHHRSPQPAGNDQHGSQDEKLAKVLEHNRNLTEWREQLVAKNQTLVEENKKLKDKCANLEQLLNEEETDINDVLELIRAMQVKSGHPGPISPMSAVGAKLREMGSLK